MKSKYIFDILIATFAIILLSPLLITLLIVVRLTSEGPAIFKQKRVGLNGSLFTIYKFRTMYQNNQKLTISIKGDNRITPVGRFLRKYKLDELPELWNILKGDMSFVGPRPDVPGYADKLTGKSRLILNLRPGITGPATLKYANEEELLASVPDPVKFNDEVIFPDKVKLNLQYLDNWSLWLDMKLIFYTIFRRSY